MPNAQRDAKQNKEILLQVYRSHLTNYLKYIFLTKQPSHRFTYQVLWWVHVCSNHYHRVGAFQTICFHVSHASAPC